MSSLAPALPASAASPASRARCRPRQCFRRGLYGAMGAGLIALTAGIADSWAGLGRRPDAERRKRMERSPQWGDGKFHNPQLILSDYAKAISAGLRPKPNASPTQPVSTTPVNAELFATPPASGLRITWLGHSTTLIEIDGQRVLTDPVWSDRVSPVQWAGIKRWYQPLLPLADLPSLDAVIISHDHYDHLDHRTMVALKNLDTRFIVPLGVGAHLEYWGVPAARITELDWWETATVGRLTFTSTPARHASGRGLFDKDLTLWSGYAIRGPKHNVYFSGDTGMQAPFADIAERLGPFDATMIEVGEYNENWADWHIGPEQAVAAVRMLNGGTMIPIHWGLFRLAPHGWTEPVERAVAAASSAGVPIATPRPGESVEPTAPLANERWWPNLPWSRADETPIISTIDGKIRPNPPVLRP